METSNRELGGLGVLMQGISSGSMDGLIEAQEARGQKELVSYQLLPKEGFEKNN